MGTDKYADTGRFLRISRSTPLQSIKKPLAITGKCVFISLRMVIKLSRPEGGETSGGLEELYSR